MIVYFTALGGTQVDCLISTLPDPCPILEFMENRPSQPKDFPDPSGPGYSCLLSGSLHEKVDWRKHHSVIARYLTTLYYTDQDMRAGTLRVVTVKEVEHLEFMGWNSLRCHPDYSGHKYCCGYGGRAEHHHDDSWARVSHLCSESSREACIRSGSALG